MDPDGKGFHSLFRRKPFLRTLTAAGFLAGLLLLAHLATDRGLDVGRYEPEVRVRLEHTSPVESTSPTTSERQSRLIRVAVAPVVSPERTLELYQGFVNYLGRKLDRKPVFFRRQSYSQVNDLVRFQLCDMALVCDYAYVIGEREFGMKLLAVPVIDGATCYYSFIVTPSSSRATSLLDFRNKRFASADVMSASGWLFPMTWLKQQGRDATRFFSEHLITGSHDRALFAVTSGLVDAAAIDSLIYERLTAEDSSLKEKTRVILRSPPFGNPPIVVPAQIDRALEHQLLATLIDMPNDDEGRRILSNLNIDRFLVPHRSLHDSVRKLMMYWELPP